MIIFFVLVVATVTPRISACDQKQKQLAATRLPPRKSFGVEIEEVCLKYNLDLSPILMLLIPEIENQGLDSIEFYSAPGDADLVTTLRNEIEGVGNMVELQGLDFTFEDIFTLADLLKQFLDTLPKRLIDLDTTQALLKVHVQDEVKKVAFIKHIIGGLSKPVYSTLRYLLEHLDKVAAESAANGMTVGKLANIFYVLLMDMAPALDKEKCERVMLFIMGKRKEIFGRERLVVKWNNGYPNT